MQVEGGDGAVTVEAGKGDVWFRGRSALSRTTAAKATCSWSAATGQWQSIWAKATCTRASARAVVVRSGSGDVQLADCAGDLIVKSGSGDVIVTRPREQRVSVSNGSGDVTIEDGSLVGMAVRTSRGDVSCNARLSLNGREQ